jgi:hypothetical protein
VVGLPQVLDEARAYNDAWTAAREGSARPAEEARGSRLMRGLFQGRWPVIIHTADARDVMATVRIFHDEYRIPCIVSHGEFGGYKSAPEIAKRSCRQTSARGPTTGRSWSRTAVATGSRRSTSTRGEEDCPINTDSPWSPRRSSSSRRHVRSGWVFPEECGPPGRHD